ncbi:hypothetical protein DFH09DRAFT_1357951 [Mycena vulgaris]|nr:hypothetical protein DFH09DRAFT_1357951 [Mycena vulgaris]
MMFGALKSFPSTQIPTSSAPSSSPALPIPTSATRSPSRRWHAYSVASIQPPIPQTNYLVFSGRDDLCQVFTADHRLESILAKHNACIKNGHDKGYFAGDRASPTTKCSAKYPVGAVATAPPSSASMAGLPRLNRHSSRRAAARAPALDYLRTHQNQSVLNFCAVPMAMATLEPYFGECGVRRRWGVDGSLHRGIAASSLPLRRQGVTAALLLPRASTSPSSLPARPPLLSLRGVAPPLFCPRVASTPSFLPYIDPLSPLAPPSSSLPPLLRCAPLPYIDLAILTLAPPADTSAPLFLIIRASPRSFRSSFRSCLCLPPAPASASLPLLPLPPSRSTHRYIGIPPTPSNSSIHCPFIFLQAPAHLPPHLAPVIPSPSTTPTRLAPPLSTHSILAVPCRVYALDLRSTFRTPTGAPAAPLHPLVSSASHLYLPRRVPLATCLADSAPPVNPPRSPFPVASPTPLLRARARSPPSVPLSLLALPRSVFWFPYARSHPFLPEKVGTARAG